MAELLVRDQRDKIVAHDQNVVWSAAGGDRVVLVRRDVRRGRDSGCRHRYIEARRLDRLNSIANQPVHQRCGSSDHDCDSDPLGSALATARVMKYSPKPIATP